MKMMDIKEFREVGLLQEVNRLFFHPRGLALTVTTSPNERDYISGIWDAREDPEGITFEDGDLDHMKAMVCSQMAVQKLGAREKLFGYPGGIQRVPFDDKHEIERGNHES